MTIFLIIYAAIALAVFIAMEVSNYLKAEEENSMFKIPVYEVNHIKCFVTSLFFPIVLLIIVTIAIVQCILERRR